MDCTITRQLPGRPSIISPGIYFYTPASPLSAAITDGFVQLLAYNYKNDPIDGDYHKHIPYTFYLDHFSPLWAEVKSQKRIFLVHLSPISKRNLGTNPDTLPNPFPERPWPVINRPKNPRDPLEVSGMISLVLSPGGQSKSPFQGSLQDLRISPFHLRRKIASQLMLEIERQALGRGMDRLWLWTEMGSLAEKIYKKRGWKKMPKGMEDKFNIDHVYYTKSLIEVGDNQPEAEGAPGPRKQ